MILLESYMPRNDTLEFIPEPYMSNRMDKRKCFVLRPSAAQKSTNQDGHCHGYARFLVPGYKEP